MGWRLIKIGWKIAECKWHVALIPRNSETELLEHLLHSPVTRRQEHGSRVAVSAPNLQNTEQNSVGQRGGLFSIALGHGQTFGRLIEDHVTGARTAFHHPKKTIARKRKRQIIPPFQIVNWWGKAKRKGRPGWQQIFRIGTFFMDS